MRGEWLVAVVPRLASAAFVLALPVLFVTTNLRVAFGDERVYRAAVRRYGAVEATGLPLEELDRASREIIAYFENDAPSLRVLVTVDGTEESLFGPRETGHMADVKRVVRAVFRANEVALAFVLSSIALRYLWAREAPLRRLAWEVLTAAGVTAVVFLGLAGVALTGFDGAWTAFHEVVFRNDLWQLDPSRDRLIQMFPEPFWRDAALAISAATLAEVALFAVGATVALLLAREKGGGWSPAASGPTPAPAVE